LPPTAARRRLALGVCVSDRHRRFRFDFAVITGVFDRQVVVRAVRAESEISQDPRSLRYTRCFTVRILVAYVLSLVFALAYGYIAAIASRGNHNDSSAGHSAIHSVLSFLPA